MSKIIAIERQFASGGHEIGEQIASRLGLEFYNQEILSMAASSLGIATENVEHLEETATSSFLC
jgi:hypothetical protein